MLTRVLAFAMVLALSGCSWVLVDGPQSAPMPPQPCTDNYLVPAIDGVITALALVGFIYFVNSDDKTDAVVGGTIEGSIALVFGVSALQGRNKVKRCKRATATYQPQPMYAPPYPPPYPAPYPPPSPPP